MSLFKKHDISHVLNVVQDQVDFFFDDDDDEIGSSDISCCVNQVLRQLDCLDADDTERSMIRNAVMNNIPDTN